ncbi:hypothetical protein Leryth_001569 [Lithospermum erythrorhizon]|nr:hypothetical protein Leryth_001569 [Lithospermum erythrorhizon]
MSTLISELGISAVLTPHRNPPRRSSSNAKEFGISPSLESLSFGATSKWSHLLLDGVDMRCHYRRPLGERNLSTNAISQDVDTLLLNAVNMSFFERFQLAWKLLFPSAITKRKSNANIAKQRLKMILFSDRCAVSDEAKQKIVQNIVAALSDFVEIESEDKVQLSVSTDPAIGTVYSVTVPVRRVKSGYQEEDETGMITNVDYKDDGQSSGSVDVTFDFYLPDEKYNDFRM